MAYLSYFVGMDLYGFHVPFIALVACFLALDWNLSDLICPFSMIAPEQIVCPISWTWQEQIICPVLFPGWTGTDYLPYTISRIGPIICRISRIRQKLIIDRVSWTGRDFLSFFPGLNRIGLFVLFLGLEWDGLSILHYFLDWTFWSELSVLFPGLFPGGEWDGLSVVFPVFWWIICPSTLLYFQN